MKRTETAGGETMQITPSMIDEAAAAGLCQDSLNWLRECSRTVDELIEHCPSLALWTFRYAPSVAAQISPEQFDRAVAVSPWAALEYAIAQLSQAQFDRVAATCPGVTFKYAAARLSLTQLDHIVAVAPRAALSYAANRLSPEQLDRAQKAAQQVTR